MANLRIGTLATFHSYGSKGIPAMAIEILKTLGPEDLSDLCAATATAIRAGGGFGWLEPPEPSVLEHYWRAMMGDPLRTVVFGARLDSALCGSVQLLRPPAIDEAVANQAQVKTLFVVPEARGRGLGRALMQALENLARSQGFDILNLDVRATKAEAGALYESLGYERWGTNPHYIDLPGLAAAGHHYCKKLR